jgi:hypothetical protein
VSLADEEDHEFWERIPEAKVQDIGARFKQQAAAMFVDAKRSAASSATHVPFFIYIIIVVLGWNEFMAVLRNPCEYITLMRSHRNQN